MKTVSWFSAGVSSAVATKLVIDEVDEIIYVHIDDQHEDTIRFVKDCEKWFGKEIKFLQYHIKNVEDVFLMSAGTGFGRFSPCTDRLKTKVRKQWERENRGEDIRYVWGMDVEEKNRALSLCDTMPKFDHLFPLIDIGFTKYMVHDYFASSGIKRPMMYELGYSNNNCVGCVKGGMGYWNKIRVDFPEVFESRAKLERKLGGSFIKGVYLDELDPERGRDQKPIVGDCGILCEILSEDESND